MQATHTLKTGLQRENQDSESISLIDFIDSHPSAADGSALLDIGAAIVQETRNQVHESGLWPTLTPDQIFLKSGSDGWNIQFSNFGAYSQGEEEGESPHRTKCVRDIYRITYFLGTGEFPLQVEPLLGKPFNRRRFPNVPKRLLSLYKQFFVLDPLASPRTLLDIQGAIDQKRKSKSFFGPVGLICCAVVVSGMWAITFLEPSSEKDSANQNIVVDKRIELMPHEAEPIAFEGPTIAEIRGEIPQERFPSPTEQLESLPSAELRIPIGNDGNDGREDSNPLGLLATLSMAKPTLVKELKNIPFPESRVVIENESRVLGKLSLEWIRNGNLEEKSQAIEWLQVAHQKGDVESTYLLAECYFYGVAIENDEAKAISLLREALEAGSGKAALMLGTIHSKGIGLDVDHGKARILYKKAIDQNCASAYGNLGVLQLRGQGGKPNAEDAVTNFRKGATLGDPTAAFYLAKCLEKGFGGKVDKEEASKWYSLAASLGHEGAVELCTERNISISAVTTDSL